MERLWKSVKVIEEKAVPKYNDESFSLARTDPSAYDGMSIWSVVTPPGSPWELSKLSAITPGSTPGGVLNSAKSGRGPTRERDH